MTLDIRDFSGIAPAINERLLPDGMATVAVNCFLNDGSLASFFADNFVVTPTKPGSRKTIYRYGQTNPDESLYWWVFTDDVDILKVQVPGDAEERTIWVGDSTYGHPRVTKASLALIGGTNYPVSSYRLGPPAPTAGPSVAVSGTGDGTNVDRSVIFTYVTGDGEESQPSPPTDFVGQDGQTFTYGSFPAVPSGYNITARRFYRAVVGNTTDPVFALVNTLVDRPIAETTFADTVLDLDLGDECPSIDWTPPPAGLKGIVNMPNGMMAGWDTSEPYDLRFCEPYVAHAWPENYKQPLDFPLVALGVFSDYLVAFTSGRNYVGIGTDPQAIKMRPADLQEVLASKRSVAATRTGLFYCSQRGICRIGLGGSGLLTEGIIDRKYWQSLNPASMHCYHYDGRYIGFYDNGTPGGFVYDPIDKRSPFTLIDTVCTAAYNDPVRDSLYLAVGADIREWEASASRKTYTWRSKVFETLKRNYRRARVMAKTYPVTFKLYGDGVLRHTETVADDKSFGLPWGYKAKAWQIELSGTGEVTRATVAQDTRVLQQLFAGE